MPGARTRVLKPFYLMTVFLFALSACDKNSQTTANSKAEKSLDIVNIGRLICGGHLPLAIVEKKYQQQFKTFQLHTVQNHDWNDVVLDLLSGKLAGTFILSPLAMNLIREGFSGKIVLLADRNGNGFVLSKHIQSIDQLQSQRAIIAVPHLYSQHHVLLHELLKQHAIPTEGIKVLGMAPRDMIHSLRSGEIDGFVVGEPESSRSISQGVGWMAAVSPQIWKDHMDHVFLASDTFINEQPEKLQELIGALVRGGEFIENNPREAAMMGQDYTGAPGAVFEQVLSTPPDWISYSNMVVNDKDMTSMAAKMVEMKLWPDVPADLDSQYFNMSFIKKVIREKQVSDEI